MANRASCRGDDERHRIRSGHKSRTVRDSKTKSIMSRHTGIISVPILGINSLKDCTANPASHTKEGINGGTSAHAALATEQI